MRNLIHAMRKWKDVICAWSRTSELLNLLKKEILLKKRSELVSKCCHEAKYLCQFGPIGTFGHMTIDTFMT